MIKTIKIQNFQSHKNTTMELSDGVNIIVGGSDSGKTAIIRALRWLIWNRPTGEAFRSNWGGETSVSVQLSKANITRNKDDKLNEYWLDDVRFAAFGMDVPEEVKQTLNINEINLQSQLDSPFLLTSSPGEVAQHFNKVAHLDQIDIALKRVQSWLRAIDQEVIANEKVLKSLEEQLLEYTDLEKIEIELGVLEELQEQVVIQSKSRNSLISICSSIETTESELQGVLLLIQDEKQVDILLSLFAEQDKKKLVYRDMQSWIYQYEIITVALSAFLEKQKMEKPVNDLLELHKLVSEKQKEYANLIQVMADLRNVRQRYESHTEKVRELEEKFIINFPNNCPLCNAFIPNKKILI